MIVVKGGMIPSLVLKGGGGDTMFSIKGGRIPF